MEKITKAEFKIRRDECIRGMLKRLLLDIEKTILVDPKELLVAETALDFYKCGLEHAGMSSKEIETIKTEAKYEIKRSII